MIEHLVSHLAPAVLMHDAYWAIEPNAGRVLLSALRSVDAGSHKAEYEARRAAAPSADGKAYPITRDGIAILSLSGPMTKAPTSFDSGTSTVFLRRALRQAANDSEVKAILLKVDSPGGSVSGTADLADDVAACKRKKPITSYIEDLGCSAAYWVASQADAVYAGRTAVVGSIGTYMVAYDCSRLYQGLGVDALVIATGPLKGAGAEGVPITPDQLASWQKTVDDLNEHFLNAVESGRRLDRDRVGELATGGVWVGEEAHVVGLVDGICPLDDVISNMRGGTRSRYSAQNNDFSSGTPSGVRLEEALDSALIAVGAAHDQVQAVEARIADVKALRESQGRRFSQERLVQLREISHACEALSVSVAWLAEDCEALGSPAAMASSDDLASQTDRATLERAVLDGQFIATTIQE